jgi:hypothetical protein
MSTILFGVEPVEESVYNRAVPVGEQFEHPFAAKATSRLSTFHMPRNVEIELNSQGQCVFRFGYPNDEPGERMWRRLSTDALILLGRHSRKVLELRVNSAAAKLRANSILFNADAARDWLQDIPWHSQHACARNAAVVAEILSKMPETIRFGIADALDRISEH